MANGIGHVDRLASEYDMRCKKLDAARAELALEPQPLDKVALHPAAIAGYRRCLQDLQPIFGGDAQSNRSELSAQLRRLIETVTVYRGDEPDQIRLEIAGKLWALIDAPP